MNLLYVIITKFDNVLQLMGDGGNIIYEKIIIPH